jgi:uncharacterized protein YcgL (UPF0745 family)
MGYLYITMIDEISKLPTYVTQDLVIDLFFRLMEASKKNRIYKNELIECLKELADQQYHQYQLMPVDICKKIEQWFLKQLDCKNKTDAEIFVLVSHCLAFSVSIVRKMMNEIESEEIKNELIEMLEHVENERINPYWDLKNEQ